MSKNTQLVNSARKWTNVSFFTSFFHIQGYLTHLIYDIFVLKLNTYVPLYWGHTNFPIQQSVHCNWRKIPKQLVYWLIHQPSRECKMNDLITWSDCMVYQWYWNAALLTSCFFKSIICHLQWRYMIKFIGRGWCCDIITPISVHSWWRKHILWKLASLTRAFICQFKVFVHGWCEHILFSPFVCIQFPHKLWNFLLNVYVLIEVREWYDVIYAIRWMRPTRRSRRWNSRQGGRQTWMLRVCHFFGFSIWL